MSGRFIRRLTKPLMRTGAKGSGEFREATWDESVENIAARWRDILAAYGGEAILPYSYAGTMGLVQRNAGHPFFHRLGASRLERTICSPAKEAGWKAVMGETEARSRGMTDGERVIAFNALGEVPFFLGITEDIPPGVAVAEGVWWIEHAPASEP